MKLVGKLGFDCQVMYVWFDALINYMSGVDGTDASKPLSRFWPASMHIVGKDASKLWRFCKSVGGPKSSNISPGFVDLSRRC